MRGVADEVVAQRLAGAEHAEQSHRRALVADQHVEQVVVARVHQADEARQGQVGIGRPAEEREQRLGRCPELGEAVAGAVDVVEAQGEQPRAAGRGVGAAHDTRWPTTARKVAASGAHAVVELVLGRPRSRRAWPPGRCPARRCSGGRRRPTTG